MGPLARLAIIALTGCGGTTYAHPCAEAEHSAAAQKQREAQNKQVTKRRHQESEATYGAIMEADCKAEREHGSEELCKK
jgi:hypothetical protein